jgi:hypothetical protein
VNDLDVLHCDARISVIHFDAVHRDVRLSVNDLDVVHRDVHSERKAPMCVKYL